MTFQHFKGTGKFFTVLCRSLVSDEISYELATRIDSDLPNILSQFFTHKEEYDLFLQNGSFDINAYQLSNYNSSENYALFLAKMKIIDQNYNFEKLHSINEEIDMLLDDEDEIL